MQAGTLTSIQTQPVLYIVSFNGGEGAAGTMTELEALGGSLSSFNTDGQQTSSRTQVAMIWVVKQGLITGVGKM